MKRWAKGEGEKFENSPSCYGWAQSAGTDKLDASRIVVQREYPEGGKFIYNDEAHEMAYILTGTGSLTSKGKESVRFKQGDILYFAPKERVRWSGDFEMFVVCGPAFDYKKHHEEDAI